MELSVVISTLNDREQLVSCLDAVSNRTPDSTELIVVNGPSSDGTSGVVRQRSDIDVLVEISERNPNVSRNAGLEAATGDIVAFVDGEYAVEPGWYSAIERTLEGTSDEQTGSADVVTGPVTGEKRFDGTDPRPPRTVARREISLLDGDNVAFDRTVLEALDGFDEYLETGGARDCAHRVAGLGFEVDWSMEMAVRRETGTDSGAAELEWGPTYRALTYRLAKNYGPRPTVLLRTIGSAVRDGVSNVFGIFSGDATPTGWFSNGLEVVTNAVGGFADGLRARYGDRSQQRNPHGVSARHDRAVQLYDRRESEEDADADSEATDANSASDATAAVDGTDDN
ncbi:glycosyltransferase family 2 protein [Natronolimnobius sp. AArcel1]|uniref:glycosyltransferase family 2 protein n=1 Tax=Natronolimnobius sp. AArcel1 TaxID=1679093 RepID=UPI0013EA4BBD|nr:glycosyltransferase family A protein [Natronolimnobius sp. AArcel1]NGM69687.1 glycosyltransferase family 2 protein [Natronolimnobius sp. AArcel1]